MKRLLPIAVLALIAQTGCDWMPGRPTRSQQPVTPDQVHDFDTLWANNCSGCHGADGRFGPARPMNDPLYLSLADDAYLREIIASGVNGTLMPPMAQSEGGALTDAQLDDVIQGMRNAWGGTLTLAGPPLVAHMGSADAGAAVFASHCSSCHGRAGNGGPKAGSLVDASFLSLTSDQALRTAVICGRADLGMPRWDGRDELPPLTSAQIGDVVAWLASHRVKHPGAPGASIVDGGAS